MAEIFSFSFNAVMPILLLMLTGYILNRLHFADDAFFKKANALVFKLFLPVLLFMNVYEIDSLGNVNWRVVLYCLFAILLICFSGFVVAKIFFRRRDQIPVITQCVFRSNYAIIGIPLAETLGGAQGVAFASVLSAFSIPLFNTLAVIILSHYSHTEHKGEIKETLKKTAKNPLIIGVFLGVAVVAVRNMLPLNPAGEVVFSIERDLPFLYSALSILSKGASPLALVVLGARFDFKAVGALKKQIFAGTFMRLVMAPVLGIGLAFILSEYTPILNVTSAEYPALISLFATPIAVSSAVMVGEIGGDEQLASQFVVWTSAFSMFSMFITVFIMKSFNLI
ncbi:MAG: AEC family transporter [Clostridia bacterium]|nr:AEC family transporter [Clostridia bacterium]